MKKYLVTMMAVVLTACALAGCGNKALEEGVELLEQEKYNEAADKFQDAVDKEKNLGEAYRGLGIALWEQEDYEGAKDAFENALDNDAEKTATIYNFLGNCDMKLDDAKSALNYYRLGMAAEDVSDEMMQEMRFNEIAAYEQLGDMESAKTKLNSYISDYPDDEKAAKEAEFLKTR